MKTYFNWDPDNRTSLCKIIYKGWVFVGSAHCHDDDLDFMGEITGNTIAEARAQIKLYQHIKNNEITPALGALKHIIASFESSDRYNPNSPEYKFIWRQINDLEKQLANVRSNIADAKQNLREYINRKEQLYIKLRKDKTN